jgi:hypothetical protein
LVANGMHYIKNLDGREELYDTEIDPWEERNVAHFPGNWEAITRFRMLLAQLRP